MADLLINGKDAKAMGVYMGKGYLASLLSFPPLKAHVENASRLIHGKRVVVNSMRYDARELTLVFTIIGEGGNLHERQASRKERAAWLRNELEKGKVEIKVEDESSDVFRLIYNGKSVTYGMNPQRTICKVSAKFEEPNPNNRGEKDDNSIVIVEKA